MGGNDVDTPQQRPSELPESGTRRGRFSALARPISALAHWAGWPKVASVATAVAAVAALFFSAQSLRATRDQSALSEQGLVTERLAKAIELIASDNIEVRTGGLYLLQRLANDSPTDRSTVLQVLAAYLHNHSPATSCPPEAPDVPDGSYLGELVRRPLDIQAAAAAVGQFASREKLTAHYTYDLSNLCLAGVRWTQAQLSGVNLDGSNLMGADISSADLSKASLSGANLFDVNALRANFTSAGLANCDFSDANLLNTDFTDARLARANLSGADLGSSTLTRAKLNGATLSGADLGSDELTDADLTDATLTNAQLDGVRYGPGTKWPSGFAPPR